MHNEQRTQATLDFATRNAFETLNKFAQWASTPNAEVQFNLIDTVSTLSDANSGINSRGIFLKPIKIPSLNSVTTGVFGPVGTDATRNMYWSVNFQSNGTGWVFDNYSPGANSSGPKANNKAELKILVNTSFGSETQPISITNRNVSVFGYNYKETIYGSASTIILIDDQSKERITLGASTSRLSSDTIFLGNYTSSSILSGDFGYINLYNQTIGKNILSFADSANGNTLTIGHNDNTNTTTILGGVLQLVGNSNQNSGFSILSQVKLIDAIYNKTYDIGIAVPLIDGLVSSVNIGSANPASITSTEVLGVSTVSIGALSSVNIYTGTGGVFNIAKDGKLFVEGNQKIHGSLKNEISSGSAVYLGIDEGDGNTSKEVAITKGQVLIPNLYMQKKANFTLSGIKHVSLFNTNPSIKFIPIKREEILNNTSTFTCEYTSKIQHTPTIRTARNEFDTTINDHNGTLNSYIGRYSSDNTITIMAAPIATTGGNQDKTITSAYSPVTVTGLSSLNLPKSSQNRLIKLWSTPNYMYVFVLNADCAIEIYYSSDAVNFSILGKPIQLSYPEIDFGLVSFDIDSITQTTIDYIWFNVLVPYVGSGLTYNVSGANLTPVTVSVVNNCGVPIVRKYNTQQYQRRYDFGGDTLVRAGNTCKIKCVVEGANNEVVAYTVEQYYGIHKEVKRSRTSLFSAVTGAVVGGITGGLVGATAATAGVLLSNIGRNATTRSTSERVRLVLIRYSVNEPTNSITESLVLSQDDAMFISSGHVADINITTTIGASPAFQIATVYYSRVTDTYKITFDNTIPSPYPQVPQAFTAQPLDNSQGLEYSGVSFVKGTSFSVKKILAGSTNLWLNTVGDYNQVISAQVYPKIKILNDNVFAYFNQSTKAIQYYSTDATPGIPLTSIQTYNAVIVPNPYNIYGMFVDYVGLTGDQFDGYNSFVLSNSSQGNGMCEYVLSSTATVGLGDRNVLVETNTNNEIVSVIDASDTTFEKRDIASISKLSGPSNYILTTSSRYAEYDENFKMIHTYGASLDAVPPSSIKTSSLNVHLEPISYLVKNINNSISTAAIANYSITSTSIDKLYQMTFNNNPYSGYRVSYKMEDENQIADSNITGSTNHVSPLGHINEDLNMSFYVYVGEEYTTVIRSDSTDQGDISEISSRLFKTNHRMVRIHNSLIDPLNSLFDPTISLTNEFGNVVSVRMDSISGFRSGPIVKYNSQIVLGLTEIASTGEPCT